MTRRRVLALLLPAVLVALACVPAAAAPRTHYSPGAPGAGDPYFPDMGNGGYDVSHYDLALKFDPSTGAIRATATITARATQNLSSFDLDLSGPLVVDAVSAGGRTTWTRQGAQELVIKPHHGIRRGSTFRTTVRYHGVPQNVDDPALGVSGWVRTADGAVALNQPIGAATYYPVNDTPRDKATYTVTITAPSDLTALANGEKVAQHTAHGSTTVTWVMRQPMASELAMVAIGRYDVTTGRSKSGIPAVTAIDTALDTAAGQGASFFASSTDTTDWLASTWGRFPFSSTGGIVDKVNVGYALETQGRPVYDSSRAGRLPGATTIAHELAHQYFGDAVTPKYWKDIWLNEGWATYNEWLYDEDHGGATADETFQDYYDSYAADDDIWAATMNDPGRDGIFDPVVYDKGAMALHVLRTTIGDKAFFALGRAWVQKFRYGNATTADFQALAEKVSHRNLDAFFDTWVYGTGKPTL